MQQRLFRAQVDAHPQQGVDEADPVRASLLDGLCDGRDVGHVRRQLDEQGLVHRRTDGPGHLVGALRRGAEAHPAAVYVRTADVQLDHPDVVGFGGAAGAFHVFPDRKAADVGDYFFMEEGLQLGQLAGQHVVDAGPKPTNGTRRKNFKKGLILSRGWCIITPVARYGDKTEKPR